MDREALVSKLGQTVGVEKADALVAEATATLEIDPEGPYSSHEVADICETIQRSTEGHLRLVANEIRVDQQAQRRFDALLDEISDPVVTVSFEGADPIVTAINPAFEATFGYDASIVGESLTDLIVPEGERADAVDQWLRSDQDGGLEVERLTADGDRRTFLFRSVVVTREGTSVEGYGIYTDITERTRRERRLELQNEQLERFASVISHDLRNPLQAANGRLEVALEATDDPAVAEHVEAALEAQGRMARLIDDLLTLARQGRVVDSPAPVDFRSVVADAWTSVCAPGAALTYEGPPDATVAADRPRLRQLLENLFRNAVEHSSTSPPSQAPEDAGREDSAEPSVATAPEDAVEHSSTSPDSQAREDGVENGSGPELRAAVADVGGRGGGHEARCDDGPGVTVRVGLLPGRDGFFVADDGPGIPPDERADVFEHGYTTREDGSGFGLAIVKAIADAHEWETAVTESRDGGARFEFTGLDRTGEGR